MQKTNIKIDSYIKLLKDFNMNDVEISYLDNKSHDFKIDNNIINYDTFLEIDKRRRNRQSFHIFFKANTNSVRTAQYIKANNPEIFKFDVYIYILRKKLNNNSIIENIYKVLNKLSVTSIDFACDIVKKISKSKSDIEFDRNPQPIPEVFINPTINILNLDNISEDFVPETATTNYIKNWFEDDKKPILVILGKGGVGKTTIAEYFSNEILSEYKETSKIFIDSVEVKTRLNSLNENFTISLYDIYKESIKGQNIIDEYYFTQNLEFNNFFIIIDGIDELISKVNKFEIENFLESILNFNNGLLNSKIIITCRSEYWNVKNDQIQLIELKAFDKPQMENYFQKIFKEDTKKYNSAINLAEEFHRNSNESKELNKFHPYALELITTIIKQNKHLNNDLDTCHLNTNIKTDYIIAKMCFREKFHSGKPRVTNLSIDEQVKILEYIAIVHNGIINENEMHDAVLFGINKNIEGKSQDFDFENYAESMISHPLLKFDEQTRQISFAYDFHTDVFKAIYIAYNLKNENILNEVKIELLKFIHEFKFSSQIVKDIKNRISKLNEVNISNLSILIDLINENRDLNEFEKKYLYSGLFNLSYELNKNIDSTLTPNKITNTKLIERIGFLKNNEVNNLCLIDITEERVIFDFSSIVLFKNCVFENYNSFWETSNEWNSTVFFENCLFTNLGKRNSKNEISWIIDNSYLNFDINSQKNMDDEFKEQIKQNKEIYNELKNDIVKIVSQFIHFFWHQNNFYSQNYTEIEPKRIPLSIRFPQFSKLKISMEDFIDICEHIDFIEWSTYNKSTKKINVNSIFKTDLKKYIQTDDKPLIVEELEKLLYEKLKTD